MVLAVKGTMPVDVLAREFNIDTDELISDLEMAACCGIPPYTPDSLLEIVIDGDVVYAAPGQELMRERRVGIRDALEFILAARVMQELLSAEYNDVIASIVDKLGKANHLAALKAHLEQPPEYIETARNALEKGSQLEIDYYSFSKDELSRRVVDPVSLSSIAGQWYLDAYCHLVNAPRRFRVSRIREAVILDTSACKGLHGLKPSKPLSTASTFVGSSPEATLVTLRVDAKMTPIVEVLPLESIKQDGDGAIVTMYSSGEVFLERLLMQLAGHGELLDPPELAGLGKECAARTLKRYRDVRCSSK
jgi:proteasome accessory factor C